MADYRENIERIVEVGWSVGGNSPGLYVINASDEIFVFDPHNLEQVGTEFTLSGKTSGTPFHFDADTSGNTFVALSTINEFFDNTGAKIWSKGLESGENKLGGVVLAGGFAWNVARTSSDIRIHKRNISDGSIIDTGTVATKTEFSVSGLNTINATSLGSLICVMFTADNGVADTDVRGRTFNVSDISQVSSVLFQEGIDLGSYTGKANNYVHRGPSSFVSELLDYNLFAMNGCESLDSTLVHVPADDFLYSPGQFNRPWPGTATDEFVPIPTTPFYFRFTGTNIIKHNASGTVRQSNNATGAVGIAITDV